MEALIERVAGLDVHQGSVVACIIIGAAGRRPAKEVRSFGAMRQDLAGLRAWLLESIGRLDEALAAATEAVTMARESGSRDRVAEARLLRASVVQTRGDLRTALRGGPWHAYHFIGHGGFDPAGAEGTLALGDDDGGTYHLGAEDLAMLLSRHTSLRLVVLNACETGRSADRDPFSSVAGALMRKGLPAAVAMQYPISNDAAVEFSRTFYESLAHRRPVDEAVTEALRQVYLYTAAMAVMGLCCLFFLPDEELKRGYAQAEPMPAPARQ